MYARKFAYQRFQSGSPDARFTCKPRAISGHPGSLIAPGDGPGQISVDRIPAPPPESGHPIPRDAGPDVLPRAARSDSAGHRGIGPARMPGAQVRGRSATWIPGHRGYRDAPARSPARWTALGPRQVPAGQSDPSDAPALPRGPMDPSGPDRGRGASGYPGCPSDATGRLVVV
jgi:hypothetical protein